VEQRKLYSQAFSRALETKSPASKKVFLAPPFTRGIWFVHWGRKMGPESRMELRD
jgi:hypothetical protein